MKKLLIYLCLFCLFGCRVKQKAARWFALCDVACVVEATVKYPRFLTIFSENSQIYEKMEEKTASSAAFSPAQALLCGFL